jgi:hypothetical protein
MLVTLAVFQLPIGWLNALGLFIFSLRTPVAIATGVFVHGLFGSRPRHVVRRGARAGDTKDITVKGF